MLQTLNFIAGGRQADAKADFFRYESCSANGADESIRVRADGNDLGLFLPGDFVNLPVFATRWEVMPVTAAATGTFRLGVGQVGSSRLTGTVRVVDQSAEKTISGSQFVGSGSSAASAGQGSLVGVRSTTKSVVVKQIVLSSSIAGTVQLWLCTGQPTLSPVITAGFGRNKLSTGAASAAEAIRGNSAGVSPTVGELPGASAVVGYRLQADLPFLVPMTTPYVLAVGHGLVVSGFALNRDVLFSAELEE